MGKYTPGPWIADPPFVSAHKRADGSLEHDIVSAAGGVRVGPVQRKANAHLIAAAPELLEACERVIDSIEGGATTPEESITYVRAAITKAKGENHDE